MTNPIFNSNPVFRADGRGRTTTQNVPATFGTAGAMTADAGALEQMYGAPAATTRDTGRMTYDDVIVRTGGMFAVLLVTGAFTWVLAPGLFWVGMVVGLVLGLVNAFKKEPSPGLIMAYAAAQGVFLGGLSAVFEAIWPGVVVQAVLATGATFAGTLMLFRSGRVRVTPKAVRWLVVAMTGYLVFSLINVGLVWFGGMDGFGLRSEVQVLGIPLGVIVGVFAVGLAAFMLIVDFDAIKRGVEQGAPARFAWTAAFGLVVTLVWLYVEFLRIFAILRGD